MSQTAIGSVNGGVDERQSPRGFFLAVPREVTLPQVRGALVTTALIAFVFNWSDFAIASVLTDDDSQTATVFLSRLQGDEFERQYGPQAALSLLCSCRPWHSVCSRATRSYRG